MRFSRRPFLLTAGLGIVIGPGIARAAAPVVGSGRAVTQRRDLGPFDAIALGGPFAVVLRLGSREAIEIVADDNLMPLVETRVESKGSGRSLHIELPPHTRIEARTPIVVTIECVRMSQLALGGTGSIRAKGLKSARLDAAIGGSGEIDLAGLDLERLAVSVGGSGRFRGDGRVRQLSVSVAGSGSCDTERLGADDVSVGVAGSGTARVRADAVLQVSIAGSGDVHHAGAAVPQTSIVGSGRVRRI